MTSSCNCPICSSYLSSHQASLYCAAYALQVTWSKWHHDGNALTLRAVPISNWSPLPVTQSLLVIGQRVTPIALNLLQKDSFWTFKLVRLHITKFPEHLIVVARTIRPYCNEQVATRRKERRLGRELGQLSWKEQIRTLFSFCPFSWIPARLNPNFLSLLSPKEHINSDWIGVCERKTSKPSRRQTNFSSSDCVI